MCICDKIVYPLTIATLVLQLCLTNLVVVVCIKVFCNIFVAENATKFYKTKT